MAYAVRLNAYPDCCGMFILSCFFPNTFKSKLVEPKDGSCCPKVCSGCRANYQNQLKDADDDEKSYQNRLRTQIGKYITDYKKKKAFFLATLNDLEIPLVEPILLKLGFTTLIPRSRNPTGSFIKTYIFDLCDEPVKKVESVLKKKVK